MKTSDLIKQAEELLGKCADGPWFMDKYFKIEEHVGMMETYRIENDEYLLATLGNKALAEFLVFARNHMQELIDKLKKYESALIEVVALSNILIASHDDGTQTVALSEAGEIAKKALEEE